MKVALPTTTTMVAKQPLLPLVADKTKEYTKDNSASFELRSTPNDANSPRYKVYERILTGGESVRATLEWKNGVYRVVQGLNVTAIPNKVNMAMTLLRGTPLTLFETKVETLGIASRNAARDAEADAGRRATIAAQPAVQHLTEIQFDEALNFVISNMIPTKALARIKRYLRRECRKPADMKVRTYFQHLIRINMEEIPMLPPFDPNQSLSDDELTDLVISGTPNSWSREMDRQGFDPIEHTCAEVVNFMEQIETSEDFDGTKVNHDKKPPGKNKKGNNNNGHNKGQKHCLIHGYGGHSTDECFKMQAEAKRLKTGDGASKFDKNKNKAKFGNKTWERKSNDSSDKTKKDLAVLIKKQVKAGVQKELNALQKKRKSNDSDDEFDLKAFDKKLDGFNYSDMDNLKIDSDDDISV